MASEDNLQLREESVYPDENVLSSVLGDSFSAYQDLMLLFEKHELVPEWRYYKDGKAWLCKVQKKKKTIVWMSAWEGFIQAALYFPIRLEADIQKLEIQQHLIDQFLETKNVGKTRPFIFKIFDSDILLDFEKVMQFKIRAK